MAWIESHQTLRDHPKIYALMDKLKISKPQAIGHLHLLWWWCVDYAQTGVFSLYSNAQIAQAAHCTGDAQKFIDALVETKFLDKVIIVHPKDKRYKKFIGQEFAVELLVRQLLDRGAHLLHGLLVGVLSRRQPDLLRRAQLVVKA